MSIDGKRAYDGTIRRARADTRRAEIAATAVALLRAGSDVSLKTVALAAGVSERHLYRTFGDQTGLADAINSAISRLLGTDQLLATLSNATLTATAVEIFDRFSSESALVSNYLESPFGRSMRVPWLAEKRRQIGAAFPDRDPSDPFLKSVEFLLSAKLWHQLSCECRMSEGEVRTLVAALADTIGQTPVNRPASAD